MSVPHEIVLLSIYESNELFSSIQLESLAQSHIKFVVLFLHSPNADNNTLFHRKKSRPDNLPSCSPINTCWFNDPLENLVSSSWVWLSKQLFVLESLQLFTNKHCVAVNRLWRIFAIGSAPRTRDGQIVF